MGLKESGLRGSLRSVSTGAGLIPASDVYQKATNHWVYEEGSGTLVADRFGDFDADHTGLNWADDGDGLLDTYGIYNGTDDHADLGSDSRSHFTDLNNNAEGAIGCWVNPSNSGSIETILGSELTNENRAIYLGWRGDLGGWEFSGGTAFRLEGAGSGTTDWVPIVGTADGSTARLYFGTDVVEIGSTSASPQGAGDLEFNVSISRDTEDGGRFWDGGIDDLWYSPEPVSVTEIEDWVADTQNNYSVTESG